MGQETSQPCDLFLKYILYSAFFIAAPPLLLICLFFEEGCMQEGIAFHSGESQRCLLEQSKDPFLYFSPSIHATKGWVFFFFFMTDVVITKVKC